MGMMMKKTNVLVCAPVECESGSTVEETVAMMERAKEEGADLVELSLHSAASDQLLHHLTHQPVLPPAIISYRLKSSRRNGGCKTTCMQVLKRALEFDVEFVEMDYELASDIDMAEHIYNRSKSKVIVSSYVNGGNFSTERLGNLIALMQSTGADVIKLDLDVDYITDLAPAFSVLAHCQVPLIVMAVGSRGLISQLLSPKFGGFLVYGHISERPVPGLPSLVSIKRVYKLEYVNAETKVFGLISNPVGHSKGPILHNPAFRHTGYNGIYVPMLVDDIKEFFRTFNCVDFAGFSVGIPHKEAAVQCCDEVHHLAKLIGAVNTIIRRPVDGKLIGYNTDCEASMSAIEDALRERSAMHNGTSDTSPISGKRFVLIGAGGAGRALAFGARSRGAHVVIFNRNYERAKALSDAVCGEALPYECLENFRPEKGMILANASAIGMDPNSHETPIPKEALKAYDLVFDAVYTPKNTRLLKEAAEVGAIVVSGVEMFIRQALGQFRLFTDGLAPEGFMRKIVLEQF